MTATESAAITVSRFRRIILFVYWPFTPRDVERFGLQTLRGHGLDVEVWDFTPVLSPGVWRSAKAEDLADGQWVHVIHSRNEGCSRIRSLTADSFVLMVNLLGYSFDAVRVCRDLTKARTTYGVFMGAPFPSDGLPLPWFDRIRRLVASSWADILRSVAIRLPPAWLGIAPASLLVLGGEKAAYPRFPFSRATEILPVHSFDYDLYLREIASPSAGNRPWAVFLDEYIPFHQDFALTRTTPYYSAEEYYPMLCRFFRHLENQLGMEVVIAAHPKSHYEDHPDYYEGRKVIKGRTIQLVREAGIVMTFFSTAIGFAVMFDKPVMLLITDRYAAMPQPRTDSACLSRLLGKRPVNISRDQWPDLNPELNVATDRYEEYKRGYIKMPGSPDEPLWAVVARKVKTLGCRPAGAPAHRGE